MNQFDEQYSVFCPECGAEFDGLDYENGDVDTCPHCNVEFIVFIEEDPTGVMDMYYRTVLV